MANLILASASPRRADLLRQAGYVFQIRVVGNVGEQLHALPPRGVELLACEKARSTSKLYSEGVVLGADTVVMLKDEIMGKPRNAEEARAMLRRLSGQKHTVITGVALVDASRPDDEVTDHVKTDVWMRQLQEEEIYNYVRSGHPFDKAGAYGIQGGAAVFVDRLEGCYYNVVGLPLSRVYLMLSSYGIKPSF